MKASIDREGCIGCGLCADTCPAVFQMAADGLAEHAADYGFILRYPSDKTEATGMDYEPWHYRYVGSEQAHKIKESGLCLEEYLAQ